MNLRKQIFWTLDVLKGSPLKNTLQYTKAILEAKDKAWADTQNKKQLEKLLKHAQRTTLFYRDKNFKMLQDFPVIDKNIIREDFDAFFSSKFKKSECKVASTSGSTGSPFSLYQNPEKVRKIQADNIYFSGKSNYQVGDFLVFLRIWPKFINSKMKREFFMKNFMTWNILNMSEQGIAQLMAKLNKRKGRVSFLTYPTALEKICQYIDELDDNPIAFNTKSIITISEYQNQYTRQNTLKYFGVTPLSRYSNNETGIMAQQICAVDERFRINDSSYVMEILELKSDHRVPNGQLGRIVLTDLFNFATPLIRYDTGDIGKMEIDADGIPYFTHISGRKVDQLYDTKGNLISSHLSLRLMDYGKFKQYQLVQKSKTEYHINLNTDKPVDEARMISDYKEHFGEDAVIKVNYVDEIPLLSSGKRREVVNEYYS